jgi:hypothetical protein
MAVLIHAKQIDVSATTVRYAIDGTSAIVSIPITDVNRSSVNDSKSQWEADRVVVKAFRFFRQNGTWPESFTVAS